MNMIVYTYDIFFHLTCVAYPYRVGLDNTLVIASCVYLFIEPWYLKLQMFAVHLVLVPIPPWWSGRDSSSQAETHIEFNHKVSLFRDA